MPEQAERLSPQKQPWERGLPPGKYYPGMESDFEVYFTAGGWPWWRRRNTAATLIDPDESLMTRRFSSYPAADLERLQRSLTERLSEVKVIDNGLSPLEERLLTIAKHFLIEGMLVARANVIGATGLHSDEVPFSAQIAAEGVTLALAAAIEIEAPLREIRDRMEVRR